ncbi:MAG: heavy-metal-associated domain-containing protein [Solirubrobacteraceae bacterium]
MTHEKTYTLQGMTCGHCECRSAKRCRSLPGIDSVKADRSTGRLVVRGESIDDEAVRQAVEAAGLRTRGLAPQAFPHHEQPQPRDQR